jgi:hypothetical protein
MSQSDRALQGYLTRGSQSLVIGADDGEDTVEFFDMFRQGVDIRSYSDMSNFISFKIRANVDPVNTLNGKKIKNLFFDDSLRDNFSSFDNSIKISQVFDHQSERRDVGQIDSWDVKFGPMFDKEDPSLRWTKEGNNFVFIAGLDVEFDDSINIGQLPLDGFIEPLMVRSENERSHIEFPFLSKGIRANAGQVEDAYRKNSVIATGYDTPNNANQIYDLSSLYFKDATEYYGPIDLMPVFAVDSRKIAPFVDLSNDREKIYKSKLNDQEIIEVLISDQYSDISDDNIIEYDIMPRNGWIFNEKGGQSIDSLVYGGMSRG